MRARLPVRGSRKRLRLLFFTATYVVLTGLVLAAYSGDWMRDTELDTVDTRFSIRGEHDPPVPLAIVDIDDQTFSDLDQQWPFPRRQHAEVIDRLTEDGAKVIAYDVQFTEPTNARDDNALIEAVDRAENVVLATTEVKGNGETAVLGGDELLDAIGARVGHALLPNDPGGVIRRMPYEIRGLRGFGVVAAELYSGRTIERSALPSDTPWIDYAGPTGHIPSYSFSRVMKGEFEPGTFRDRVVVVGPSVPSLQDLHPTSTAGEDLMPGSEIQANTVATAVDGFPIEEGPAWLDVLFIVLLGAAGPLAAQRLRLRNSVAAVILTGVLFCVGAQLLFNAGVIIAVLYPLAALALGGVGALALQIVVDAFERERVRDIFARFVPEAVVDEVLAHTDEDVRLGGVRREVTVMFTDVRGFTTFSETRPPDEVIDILNRYLSAMTDVIMKHGGTLISYMGDGIMAVFGAPIEQPDHADRALAAAREMVTTALDEFNRWIAEQGGEGFRMGAGLNSGPVMAGNVGSEQRLEYTAIGDVTNTASRLEGLTKGTPHMIFLADSTRAAMTQAVDDLIHVDELAVRGKQAAVSVWSVSSGTSAPADPAAEVAQSRS